MYFGLMQAIKNSLPVRQSKGVELIQSLLVGTGCGMVATVRSFPAVSLSLSLASQCFNAPFDVAKSRFQSQLPQRVSGQRPKYRFTLQTLWTVYREEGPLALYKGWAPKVLRMGLGGGVGIATFELVVHLFA